ncbi:MAG: phytoene/squalene synthase family protein [Ancalomicrobiaceae bacterium]|nr:phytoene/squalene synthase family protein [Ancalomicrobiaceae bacterium]
MDDAYTYCSDRLHELDKERFFAGLFTPEPARRHVFAILAFSAEIARVRDVVSDPLPGEVRLQWWRDLMDGTARGECEANPIAAALTDTIARFGLPLDMFHQLIEARSFDLYDDPMPSLADLETYARETSSALIRLSSIVLAGRDDVAAAAAAEPAGIAYGLTGLLRSVAFHAARGQTYLPTDLLEAYGVDPASILAGKSSAGLNGVLAELRARTRARLAETRTLIAAVPKPAAPAFLACALVEPMLKLMDRADYDPFRTVVDLPQWRKQLTLWWMARRAR